MAIDTSISPYFDDYSADKNFHKILFKPGVAVQARELTQSQTILQNQIKRVGDYLFTNGEKVTGPKPITNLDARSVRISRLDIFGRTIDINDLLDKFVISPTNDVIGFVEFVYQADTPTIGDPASIVISLKKFNSTDNGYFSQNSELHFYTEYSDALNKNTPEFTAIASADVTINTFGTAKPFEKLITLSQAQTIIRVGDLVNTQGLTKEVYVTEILSQRELAISEPLEFNVDNDSISFIRRASNPTTIVTQDEAVFYNQGYFVQSNLQSIVPDRNTNFPSKYVGYFYRENVVTSVDDPSLLDPAVGSSNYFAPGADRLKIDLVLASVNIGSDGQPDTREDFLPIAKFVRGTIEYIKEISGYSDLDVKLAERTYDESGSYVVDRFTVIPQETTEEANVLLMSVTPGKAYVGGYQVKTIAPTTIEIPKNVLTETVTEYNINTTQGNYWKIDNLQGSLPLAQQPLQHTNFLEAHNVLNPTDSSSLVGIVEARTIEYDSFVGSTPTYKLFISNYSPVKEAPLGWPEWAAKYKLDEIEARDLSNVLYESNLELPWLLGADPVSYTNANGSPVVITKASGTRFYALNREPDPDRLAYYFNLYKSSNYDLTKIAATFISEALRNNSIGAGPDTFERLTSNSKGFLTVVNNSPFYSGITSPLDIKSLVRVANKYTEHAEFSTYASPSFKVQISSSGRLNDKIVTFDKKDSDLLVFPVNKEYVKSVNNLSTEYIKTTQSASFTSGVYTKSFSPPESFPLGSGSIPASVARQYITMVVKSGASGSVPLGTWAFEAGAVTVSGDSLSVTIDTGDTNFNGLADINFRIENDSLVKRQKIAIENQYKIVNLDRSDKEYSLGISDVYAFGGVYRVGNVQLYAGEWSPGATYTYNQLVTYQGIPYISQGFTTNVSVSFANAWTIVEPDSPALYVLDTGQRDSIYDHATIKYIGQGVAGNILLSYNYYTHTGEGPITAESYPDYNDIPTYRSTVTSKEYVLRDSVDFRPRRLDNSPYRTFDTAITPISSFNTEADVEYYLGRKDRLYVTNRNQNFSSPYNRFFVVSGVQDKNPNEPTDDSDLSKLLIATLEIPPYTVNAFDVIISYEDNKRYTMRDIGRIEDLAINLEKAVRLQTIEVAILRNIITNEDGDILLKTGILAEDFTSLDKSDLVSGYFSCAIDESAKECFPGFNAYNLDLFLTNPGDIFVFNDIITKTYEEELFVANLEANGWINVNPAALDDGRGRAITTKKNSFSLNLRATGGALILQSLALKIISASIVRYAGGTALGVAAGAFAKNSFSNLALQAAYNGEGVLSIAWGAVRDLGLNFYEAITSIDGFTKFVVDSISPVIDVATRFYSWVKGGVSELLGFSSSGAAGSAGGAVVTPVAGWGGTSTALGAANAGAATAGSLSAIWSSTVTTVGESLTAIGNSFGYFLEGNIPAGIDGIATGFKSMANAISVGVLNVAILAAETLAIKVAAVPILGPYVAALATKVAAGLKTVLAGPLIVKVIVAAAIVYVAVKVVQKVWNTVKKWFSDRRMKTNIGFVKKMDNGLNLYAFKYKEEFKKIVGEDKLGWQYGYMADEVEKLYPEAVYVADNGYKMVDYSKIGIRYGV